MSEEMNLVRDLAVILVSAGIFTIISRALKQPLILGYIIAGFLVGPNIDFFPGISSAEAVHEWSEIGIIFLMFGLGLEFSFKRLLKVGSSALVTAGTKFVGVFLLGFVVGMAMGWTTMECVFLAGLLSMSSTMVVIKTYDEMGMKDRPFAGMVFGTLVVEDLIAILLMVLFSTIAVSKTFAGGEMLMNLGKLGFFIILWFLVGIYLIPTILKKAKKYMSDEILLLVSIGLCFGMVTFAEAVGFSSALGAFVMGSILAETVESEHIEKLVSPIKDLFGAIFFVSVGMMLSPSVIVKYWWVILILTLVVILSHIVFAGVGILMTGKGLKNAVFTGFSLAQLGEFGFILAGVGVTLGVMREFIYPVIIAVSVITTFTTPYIIKLAGPTYSLLTKKLPAKVLARIDQPEAKKSKAEQNDWHELLKKLGLRVVLYGVILIAISVASDLFLMPLLDRVLDTWSELGRHALCAGATVLFMFPFLYGIGISSGAMGKYESRLTHQNRMNAWPILGLAIFRAILASGFVVYEVMDHFHLPVYLMVIIGIAVFSIIFIGRNYFHRFSFVEDKFINNLNQRENAERIKAPVTTTIRETFEDEGYDVHLEHIKVEHDSALAGKTIRECQFRKLTGANIIKLQRGDKSFIIPSADTVLFPHDTILAVGTSDQIRLLKELMTKMRATAEASTSDFGVSTFVVRENSIIDGKTVQDLGMRRASCMIVSVLRNDNLVTNPGPDYVFKAGDKIWIAGEKESCEWYMKN